MADFRTDAYSASTEAHVQPQRPYPSSELYLNFDCIDEKTLKAAYEQCRKITQRGSKTFYFGSLLLPYKKRQAMWAVYTFCRFTDDMVDTAVDVAPQEVQARLEAWENQLQHSFEGTVQPNLPHMVAWSHAARSFNIPPQPSFELIEGVRMDLHKARYANFDELYLYCYRVASTVGLMASEIISYTDPRALEYAIKLGIAMQLTNILRDIGEDARNGRIYLPLDEMQRYGYSETELLRGEINERFIHLMKFQIDRTRRYYEQALPGIQYLSKDCRLSITVATQLYSLILDRIERNAYDVFNRRAFVPTKSKMRGLVEVWVRQRFSRNLLP